MNHNALAPAPELTPPAAELAPQPARRVRRSPQQKAELITRFEVSGLKVGDFCQREGLSAASFYLWRKEARKVEPGAMPGRLLRVETAGDAVPAMQTDPTRVTAQFRNGVEIRVGVEHLGALVRAVASC